jgi:hypothetical protein
VAVSTNTSRTTSIAITVNSVPQGASLKVDGKEVGTTPKIVDVAIGKHTLEFSKEGFNSGKFPPEITSRDASGVASAMSLVALPMTPSSYAMVRCSQATWFRSMAYKF